MAPPESGLSAATSPYLWKKLKSKLMSDATVTPNNIHLESSFKIRKEDFESELKTLREQYPDSLVWNRSIKSLKHEWAAHNAMYAMGIARKQTAHADLNWPQPWLIRIGYAIIGTIVWPFIK